MVRVSYRQLFGITTSICSDHLYEAVQHECATHWVFEGSRSIYSRVGRVRSHPEVYAAMANYWNRTLNDEDVVEFKLLDNSDKDSCEVEFKRLWRFGADIAEYLEDVDTDIQNAAKEWCFWCYPSVFGVVMHALCKGYEFPMHVKNVPLDMRPAITRILEQVDLRLFRPADAPTHGPRKTNFEWFLETAMERMGMTYDMKKNPKELRARYNNFIRGLLVKNCTSARFLRQHLEKETLVLHEWGAAVIQTESTEEAMSSEEEEDEEAEKEEDDDNYEKTEALVANNPFAALMEYPTVTDSVSAPKSVPRPLPPPKSTLATPAEMPIRFDGFDLGYFFVEKRPRGQNKKGK